jgi:hypothetical protein
MRKQDLYELILSLTPAEKKVFKEKNAGKSEGNFIRLFDAIASGKAEKDEDLRKLFEGEAFLSHLHKTKAYLYEALLDTLLISAKASFSRLQILQKLEHAEVLLSRKMISQAEDVLVYSLEMARKCGEQELALFIATELSNLQTFVHEPQSYRSDLQAIQDQTEEQIMYSRFYLQLLDAYSQRGKKGAISVEQFADHPLLNPMKTPVGIKAQRTKEACKSLVYTVQKKYNLALQSNLHLIHLTQGLEQVSAVREVGFVNLLFNIYNTQQNQQANFTDIVAKLESFKPYSRWGKSQHFVCLSRIKLSNHLNEPNATGGHQLIKWVINGLKENEGLMGELELIKIHFSIAAVLLKHRDFSRALDHLLVINNSKEARDKRTIIYRVAQIYQLIAYYELSEYDTLSTKLRNYKYYQKTDDSFFLIEQATHGFLNKAINEKDKKRLFALKEELTNTLLAVDKTDLRTGLAYLQNIGWIQHPENKLQTLR